MERGPDKPELQVKLARCRVLLRDYPDGPTAEYIREPESELRDQLPALEEQYPDLPPARQENGPSPGDTISGPRARDYAGAGDARRCKSVHIGYPLAGVISGK
jgi:hypothetical protein